MKLQVVFVLYLISVIVKGVIWGAAAVEPLIQILGIGSIFAAWNEAKTPEYYDHASGLRVKAQPDSDSE